MNIIATVEPTYVKRTLELLNREDMEKYGSYAPKTVKLVDKCAHGLTSRERGSDELHVLVSEHEIYDMLIITSAVQTFYDEKLEDCAYDQLVLCMYSSLKATQVLRSYVGFGGLPKKMQDTLTKCEKFGISDELELREQLDKIEDFMVQCDFIEPRRTQDEQE